MKQDTDKKGEWIVKAGDWNWPGHGNMEFETRDWWLKQKYWQKAHITHPHSASWNPKFCRYKISRSFCLTLLSKKDIVKSTYIYTNGPSFFFLTRDDPLFLITDHPVSVTLDNKNTSRGLKKQKKQQKPCSASCKSTAE
jgi:hypothetical protein